MWSQWFTAFRRPEAADSYSEGVYSRPGNIAPRRGHLCIRYVKQIAGCPSPANKSPFADSHSEMQIKEAIAAVSRKRTTIMVAHRLTTVQNADRIIVFDKGRVVEEGKHNELVCSGGIYEQMIRAQNMG